MLEKKRKYCIENNKKGIKPEPAILLLPGSRMLVEVPKRLSKP